MLKRGLSWANVLDRVGNCWLLLESLGARWGPEPAVRAPHCGPAEHACGSGKTSLVPDLGGVRASAVFCLEFISDGDDQPAQHEGQDGGDERARGDGRDEASRAVGVGGAVVLVGQGVTFAALQ